MTRRYSELSELGTVLHNLLLAVGAVRSLPQEPHTVDLIEAVEQALVNMIRAELDKVNR